MYFQPKSSKDQEQGGQNSNSLVKFSVDESQDHGTSYTISTTESTSKCTTTSTDSSNPRRVILKEIPDLRMFKFARKASTARKLTEKRKQEQSQNRSQSTSTNETILVTKEKESLLKPADNGQPRTGHIIASDGPEQKGSPKSAFKEFMRIFNSRSRRTFLDQTGHDTTIHPQEHPPQYRKSSAAGTTNSKIAPDSLKSASLSGKIDTQTRSRSLETRSKTVRIPVSFYRGSTKDLVDENEDQNSTASHGSSKVSGRALLPEKLDPKDKRPRHDHFWFTPDSNGLVAPIYGHERINRRSGVHSEGEPEARPRIAPIVQPLTPESGLTHLPVEVRREHTPQTPKNSSGKFRGYFLEYFTPDGSEDLSGSSLEIRQPYPMPLEAVTHMELEEAPRNWYRVRLDQSLDEEFAEDFGWDIPEHLPSSPLCPLNPKHPSGGSGICPRHGRKGNRIGTRLEMNG